MKKVVLGSLVLMLVACSAKENSADIDHNSDAEGSYFNKKQRVTLTIHKNNAGAYLMDTKTLSGERKDEAVQLMSDAEISEYFKGRESDVKKGTYLITSEGMCKSVFIKYEGDEDGYLANCMTPSLSKYEKQ